jgi:preprotein translocase subunit SecE
VNVSTYITIGVILVAFGLLWWSGQLTRLVNYWEATREELRKCTWPTWAELKGSTLVVMISIAILGLFTVLVDLLFSSLVRWIT